MCIQKIVRGLAVQCCPDSTCVEEHCVPRVLAFCQPQETVDVGDAGDNSWLVLFCLWDCYSFFSGYASCGSLLTQMNQCSS